MVDKDNLPADAVTSISAWEDLRSRVVAIEKAEAALSPGLDQLSPEIMRLMLHELRAHQVELEMQNEELRQAQAALDASRARYVDLYEMAPVGYLTLSEIGLILQSNLAASTMLGVVRGNQLKVPFSRFIFKEDQSCFYLHCKRLLGSGDSQTFELRMLRADGSTFWGGLSCTVV